MQDFQKQINISKENLEVIKLVSNLIGISPATFIRQSAMREARKIATENKLEIAEV